MGAIGVEVATEVVKEVSIDAGCRVALLRLVIPLLFSLVTFVKENGSNPA